MERQAGKSRLGVLTMASKRIVGQVECDPGQGGAAGSTVRTGAAASHPVAGGVGGCAAHGVPCCVSESERPDLWRYSQGVGHDRVLIIAGRRVPTPIAVIVLALGLAAVAALVFVVCVLLIPGI